MLYEVITEFAVLESRGDEVRCRIVTGGELRNRKGINLPGVQVRNNFV